MPTASSTIIRQFEKLQSKVADRCRSSDTWVCPDPVTLAAQADLILDDWQQEVCLSTSSRISLNCSRQVGKSTVTSVLAMHTALSEPDSLCLLISPSLRQSAELFRSCLTLYRRLGKPIRSRQESVTRLDLENGSRIISLPGTEGTTRGFAKCKLLCVDEASRVEDSLYHAIRPFLAVSNGRLITLSTPAGKRGWWYQAWVSDEPWSRFMVKAEQCPRISKDFLEEERSTLGQYIFEQEYCCAFNDAEGSAFREEDIQRIVQSDLEVWPL